MIESMRRYLYSNLLRITFSSFLIIFIIPSLLYFICSLLINKILNIVSLVVILSCLLLRILLELVIFVLNKKAKNGIVFYEGKILYKSRTFFSNDVSIKYFKLYISIIDPSLEIPKVHINGNNLSVTCYLSKKDIKKVNTLNFKIKKI